MAKSIILIMILLKSISVFSQYYETMFEISSYGYEINSISHILNSFTIKNIRYCSMECSEINECSYFDFDSSTNWCRLFDFGQIRISLSLTSRVGSVKYSIEQYFKYNQTCQSNLNEINRYLICGNNHRYQCSQGLFWNGTMCTGLYWGIGPQLNLSLSMLNGFQLTTILNQCNKSKLLLGCGPLITPNIYSVAAMDYRINVLYNCSNNYSCSYISNGLQWYFSDNSSWGFAGQSDNILRNPCDTTTTSPYTRLCWHTVPGWDGYRCSSILFNTSIDPTLWQRAVWHAD